MLNIMPIGNCKTLKGNHAKRLFVAFNMQNIMLGT